MRIECEMNEKEFDWWLEKYRELKDAGYTVERVCRNENGGIDIKVKPISLSESDNKYFREIFRQTIDETNVNIDNSICKDQLLDNLMKCFEEDGE